MFEEEFLAAGSNELSPVVAGADESQVSPGITNPVVTLEPAHTADQPFLYQTYASTRDAEMALTVWNADQQEIFLRMQYEAQRKSYDLQFPDAKYWVILSRGVPAGRLIVDRTSSDIHVIDIALVPEFRGCGIGSTLMKAIQQEAAQSSKTVTLHVERFNPALQLYVRLGFLVTHTGPIYFEMVWRPSSQTSSGSEPPSDQERMNRLMVDARVSYAD